ncbi:MAG TPA: PEPxxWA-CTERM sorting domain-containing protein [Caulobacteraceae bacterium]|jgi:hypothetical protein|nr:PEPxxWA-CTERM sorting domain-containing protein [Caulobacteraceae bacterium]
MQRKKLLFAAASAALALGTAWGAQAQVTGYDIGINPTNEQTGPTTVTSTGGFFSARVFLTNASDFDGGTITIPGGAVQPLTPAPGPILTYGVGDASLSDLNATFPMGTYSLNVTNSMTSAMQTLTVDYSVAADSLSTPTLSASSFTALQDLHAGSGFDFAFNSFVQNPAATQGSIFLNVTDQSGNSVFSENFADPTSTSFFMPGGTLVAGKTYSFDLNFDERIIGADPADPSIGNTIFFDTHTDGTFTTAVPEPASWALMLVGFGGIGAMVRGGRRRVAAA